MNERFGRLIESDNIIEYAPSVVKYNGIFYSSPSDEIYLKLNYKYVVNEQLQERPGLEIIKLPYTQDDTHIYFNYKYKNIDQNPPFEISKIHLRIALIKLGIWDQFYEWMGTFDIDLGDGHSIKCSDAWDDALVIDTGSELFGPYLEKAIQHFSDVVDEKTIRKILISCEAK